MTSDIFFANNSLKASDHENIEDFFIANICEKSKENEDQEEESNEVSPEGYYDEEGESYGEDPEFFLPNSDHTSQYVSSKNSQSLQKTTSLQEILAARLFKEEKKKMYETATTTKETLTN